MSHAQRWNYPQETILAFCIAILFLFSSGTRVNFTPIPVTVKTLAPKKKAEDEDGEDMEIEKKVTRGQVIKLFRIKTDSLRRTPSHIQKMSRRALQHRKTLTAMKEYNLTYDY